MITVDEVRRITSTLPRSYEVVVRDQIKFRVGRIVYLAFSRDVLDEALRLADAGPAEAAPAPAAPVAPSPAAPAPGRPPLAITSLGGFEASRAGVPVAASELGGERARELLAALLSARRPVGREQLIGWLWPGEPGDRATRSLSEAVAGLRRALHPADAPGAGLILAEGSTCRLALGPDGDARPEREALPCSGGDVVGAGPRCESEA